MTRKMGSIGIALVVSIPLAPFLFNGIAQLIKTDVPVVVADPGWRLAGDGKHLRVRPAGNGVTHISALSVGTREPNSLSPATLSVATAVRDVSTGQTITLSATSESGEVVLWGTGFGRSIGLNGDTGVLMKTGPETTVGQGWYDIQLSGGSSYQGLIVLSYYGEGRDEQRFILTNTSDRPVDNVGWIYFNEPGTLTIAVSAGAAKPAVQEASFGDMIRKSRDIAFAKVELTVFLLCEVLPIVVWILMVCLFQHIASWAIHKLPLRRRQHAENEVHAVLAVTKWMGIGCYVLWTAKDILAGVGIVFAGS
jgi:hypothetical protein